MTEFRLMVNALDEVYEALERGEYPGSQWCADCGCLTNHTEHLQNEENEDE